MGYYKSRCLQYRCKQSFFCALRSLSGNDKTNNGCFNRKILTCDNFDEMLYGNMKILEGTRKNFGNMKKIWKITTKITSAYGSDKEGSFPGLKLHRSVEDQRSKSWLRSSWQSCLVQSQVQSPVHVPEGNQIIWKIYIKLINKHWLFGL